MGEVEMVIDSVRQSPANLQWVVTLKEKLAERYLLIYVGLSQANTIERELTDVRSPKAITQDLGLTGIDTADLKLESVTINRFDDNAFYAKLLMTSNNKAYEVNCPAAKALAIAVRTKVPVFADEAILNKAGISVPA